MRGNDGLNSARILIVDDQETNLQLLERVLRRAGYTNVISTVDPTQVGAMYEEHEPDLIVLDLLMPKMDGYEVMLMLASHISPSEYLPILVLTADSTPEARRRALSMGARDFLNKPFDHDEALLRIRNLLETRSLYLRLQDQNEELEARVRQRTSELQQSLDQLRKTDDHRRMLLARMAEVQRFSEVAVEELAP